MVDVSTLKSNLNGNFAATCDVILRREPAELYGQIFSIQASLLQSTNAGECKNVLVSERKKAPSKISASFIRDPGAGGEDMAEGTKDKPLEVAAGEALPVVAVRSINGEGKEIVDWLRQSGKVGPLRFNQSVLHAFGPRQGQVVQRYPDTPHTSGFDRIGETDNRAHFGRDTVADAGGDQGAIDLVASSVLYHSLSASYDFASGARVRVGMANVTDEKPPRMTALGTSNEVTILGKASFYSQYDWLGRRIFMNLTMGF